LRWSFIGSPSGTRCPFGRGCRRSDKPKFRRGNPPSAPLFPVRPSPFLQFFWRRIWRTVFDTSSAFLIYSFSISRGNTNLFLPFPWAQFYPSFSLICAGPPCRSTPVQRPFLTPLCDLTLVGNPETTGKFYHHPKQGPSPFCVHGSFCSCRFTHCAARFSLWCHEQGAPSLFFSCSDVCLPLTR